MVHRMENAVGWALPTRGQQQLSVGSYPKHVSWKHTHRHPPKILQQPERQEYNNIPHFTDEKTATQRYQAPGQSHIQVKDVAGVCMQVSVNKAWVFDPTLFCPSRYTLWFYHRVPALKEMVIWLSWWALQCSWHTWGMKDHGWLGTKGVGHVTGVTRSSWDVSYWCMLAC